MRATSRAGSYKPSIRDAPVPSFLPELDAQGPLASYLLEIAEPQDRSACTPKSQFGGGPPAIRNMRFGIFVSET